MAKAKVATGLQSIDAILAKAEDPAFVRVVTAQIPFISQEVRDHHAELEADLAAAIEADTKEDSLEPPNTAGPIADQLEAIQAGIELSSVTFTFKGIGQRAWADLLREHPPEREHLRIDKNLDYNPETFPAAAIAASCADPKMTVEQVQRLEAAPTIDVAAWRELWGACLRANVRDAVPKSMLAGLVHRRNGASEKRRITTESLDQYSSDE